MKQNINPNDIPIVLTVRQSVDTITREAIVNAIHNIVHNPIITIVQQDNGTEWYSLSRYEIFCDCDKE